MEFTKVYRECSSSVRRTLLRFGVPEKDVADATQDVFAVVHRKLGAFEGRSGIDTWVHGICRRVAADYRRRACNRHEVLSVEVGCKAVHLEDVIEARLAIESALARLDKPKREVIVAFALEEAAMHAVARALRVPLQTAYARLYAGHRALREMFQADEKLGPLSVS